MGPEGGVDDGGVQEEEGGVVAEKPGFEGVGGGEK